MSDESDQTHPAPDVLRRLTAGELPAEELEDLLYHLLDEGCEQCRGLVEPALAVVAGPASPLGDAAYDFPVARACSAALAFDDALSTARFDVARAIAQIAAHLRPATASTASPLHRFAWCGLLADALRDAAGGPGAVPFGRLAALLADKLVPQPPLSALQVADVQARAWAELANALRTAGELPQAAGAMERALDRLVRGSGDPLLAARVADLVGSLETDRRRFPAALEALDQAHRLYLDHGEPHLAGRVLIKAGIAYGTSGEPERAIEAFAQSLRLLDHGREPRLAFMAVHNCLLAQVEAGRFSEAEVMLWRARPAYEVYGRPLDRIRLVGIEAKVAHGLGQIGRAERMFREVKEAFADADLEFDEALMALELAAILIESGRPAEVPGLVEEMLGAFLERDVFREAIAALSLLRDAGLAGRATVALVHEAAQALRHAEERARLLPRPQQ